MAWRIAVVFPEATGDDAAAFTHRVGNLQEDARGRLLEIGGDIPDDQLDRVGYGFTVDIRRKRDLKAAAKLVRRLCADHIPERQPTLTTVES